MSVEEREFQLPFA